jgi:hypothetical protein
VAQLNPNQYKRIGAFGSGYASSDGWYYDATNSRAVLAIGGTIRAKVPLSQTSGQAMLSDGTDMEPTALSGVLAVSGAGVTTFAATQVNYVKVPVTATEIKAINATPKTIVAAPGAGFTTVIQSALLVLNWNSQAYANNGILGLYETNASGTLLTGTLTLASFLAQTADTQKELNPTAASATTGLTRGDNKAVVLTAATGETITGDSPVDVHCWYSTVPNGL